MNELRKTASEAFGRRAFLKAGALGGVATFLAACGTKGTASESSAAASSAPAGSSAPASAPAAGATPSPTMNWANWTYYIDVDPDDQKKHPSLDLFKDKYGTTINYSEVIEDNDGFFGAIQPQLQKGEDSGWDIITMTDWMAARLIRLGWIEPINLENTPNLVANIKDTYKTVDWDPNVAHHAPWQSGMTGIGFDPAVTGELTSLAAFFTADPRWKGKTEFLTEMRDTMGLTMLHLGLDPTKPTRAGCDQAVAALQKAKDDGIVRALKGNSYAEDLKAGDAVLVMGWSGDMVQVLVDKPGVKFAIADEGGMLWTDNMMIPKGAKNKGTAELWINFYYQPEIAAMVEAYVNYICPCKGADAVLKASDPEIANNPLIFPPDALMAKLRIFGALNEDDEKYFNEQFAKVLGVG